MPKQNRTTLTNKQEGAVLALLSSGTKKQAAALAKISPATLDRWLAQPAFRSRLKEVRWQLLNQALGQLTGSLTDAVSALQRAMNCGNPTVEMKAACQVFELTLHTAEAMGSELLTLRDSS